VQARQLGVTHLGGVVGVVADQDLDEVRVKGGDVLSEAFAVLQLEDPHPALLDRHGKDDATAPGRLGHW
jgi:hypothetical protein